MLYVFDMDGVLFRMDDPLPFAAETIARLKSEGHAVYYLTNNSSKSRTDYVDKLARFAATLLPRRNRRTALIVRDRRREEA